MVCGTLRPTAANLEALAVISNRTAYRDDGVELAAHWVAATKGETHGLSNSLFDDPWPKVKLGEKLMETVVDEAVAAGASEDELLEMCFGVLSHNTFPDLAANDTYEREMDALMLSVFIPAFDASPESNHCCTGASEVNGTPEISGEPEVDGTLDINGEPEVDGIGGAPPTAESMQAPNGGPPKKLLIDTDLKSTHVDHLCLTPKFPAMSDEERQSPRLYGTAQQTVILVDNRGRLRYVERTLYDGDAKPVPAADRDVSVEFEIEGWSQA